MSPPPPDDLDALIAAEVDSWPPLTSDQLAELAVLLRPDPVGQRAA